MASPYEIKGTNSALVERVITEPFLSKQRLSGLNYSKKLPNHLRLSRGSSIQPDFPALCLFVNLENGIEEIKHQLQKFYCGHRRLDRVDKFDIVFRNRSKL